MIDFKKKYADFINEALVRNMRVNNYVKCDGNFAKITPVKGLIAKIIRNHDKYEHGVFRHYYTLEFEIPLIDRRGPEPIESNIIDINANQIKNLTVIIGKDYERIKAGYTLKYEASQEFMNILRFIKFNLKHVYYDASYFDIDDSGNVTMLPSSKVDLVPENERYTSKFRQVTKISRLLLKLNDNYTEKEIENYGTAFRAIWKELNEDLGDRIKVVTGKLITYWYLEDHYNKGENRYGGTLNSSCMRYARTQGKVSFYSEHPDKIALCILTDEYNKLLARALIWKLDVPEGVIFMDRIYYVLPEHEMILMNYAKKQGWVTKKSGFADKTKMAVNIGQANMLREYPYFDTFRVINKNELRNK